MDYGESERMNGVGLCLYKQMHAFIVRFKKIYYLRILTLLLKIFFCLVPGFSHLNRPVPCFSQ